ncbi:GH3 auxin-responsive promoter [Alcanivorax sp. PN-3]|jgi:GH3 auxin-responsive promoter|nr:GH3 auxin-responsive promoter [Alcanivorax sp. PN-3]
MLSQRLLHLGVLPAGRRFRTGLSHLEHTQRFRHRQLMRQVAASPAGREQGIGENWSWERFAERLPVTGYEDWRARVEQGRRDGVNPLIASPTARYQPTSGSTSAIKWIPYSRAFLGELDGAIGPWLADLYQRYPKLRHGRHYWSLSWMPTALRESLGEELNDDLALMSWGKRLIAGATQSVPSTVALARTSDDSLFATLAYLVADRRLSLLSVWSPTFGIGLLEGLAKWREELAEVLNQGDWGLRRAAMAESGCPRCPRAATLLRAWDGELAADFFRVLWPALALVSAWDTAASEPWARRLQSLLPHAEFQGKGLWATEGVVTFPCQGRYPLAYRSHVYEFQDPDDGAIYAPWELEAGQRVMPLLSTGSGLLRYRLNDLVEVTEHWRTVPCLRFLGRRGTVDLVGEKMTGEAVNDAFARAPLPPGVTPVGVVACDDAGDGKPGYLALLEGSPQTPVAPLAEHLEQVLGGHFHYRLARNLHQLAPLRCVVLADMRERYLGHCRDQGMIEGNIKIESLRAWPGTAPAFLAPSASPVSV